MTIHLIRYIIVFQCLEDIQDVSEQPVEAQGLDWIWKKAVCGGRPKTVDSILKEFRAFMPGTYRQRREI